MTFRTKARRAGWLLVVAAFAFGIVSAIKPHPAAAYGLISTRSIKMTSSSVGTVALGQKVMYTVGFTVATTPQTIGAIVIHFCSNDPIIGDTCSAPAGFNTNKATLTIGGWSSTGGVSNIATAPTIDSTNSNTNTVYLKWASTQSLSTGTPTNITFNLGDGTTNGFTNPSTTNATFFARITIYNTVNPAWYDPGSVPAADSGTGAGTNSATEKTATDAGGVAMSTANVLAVTAKVQEQLTFCVHTGNLCTDGGSAVNMGDTNNVLSSTTTPYTDATPKIDIASNALGGVNVRLKGDTLTSGSFTITAIGATGGACVQDSSASSSEQFGVRVVTYGAGQYNGDVNPASPNNTGGGATANDFSCLAGYHKFDPAQTNTTYGQSFIRTVGATDISTSNIELEAKAANTTEAGVYTTNLQFIATATY